MQWINEGSELPQIGQPVLLCIPRQFAEFWDMRVMCLLVRHEGVAPIPVAAGDEWPTTYYWGYPSFPHGDHVLITGNSWWASMAGINLPPRAVHKHVGPRHDHAIMQVGDVWVPQGARRSA